MVKWALILAILLGWQLKPAKVTPKQIFAENKNAVVHVYADGKLSGCGFIVSEDGLIVTANHVITTMESDFTEPAKSVEIKKVGEGKSHFATIVDHSQVADTALLRIVGTQLPHTTLSKWSEAELADAITIITFFPESDFPLLLVGTASGTGELTVGSIKANAIIFQAPIRKGFSGSPVFDSRGQVIGIVSTRMVGINPDLDAVRKGLITTNQQMRGSIMGVDFGKTTLELIDSLDADLVSGLGSGISISYAEQMIQRTKTEKQISGIRPDSQASKIGGIRFRA